MTWDQARNMAGCELVELGAHTVTHPALVGLGGVARSREITESKRACEAIIGAPVVAFAYPYGDFDAETREVVKTAGFAFACGTQNGPANATSDIFALPRIYAPDLAGDEFEQALHTVCAFG